MAKKRTELKVIRTLLSAKVEELKLRRTAEWLNEGLPKPFQRSFMTINNWVNGVYAPDDVVLIGLRTYYPAGDPRHDAAVEIMDLRGTSTPWSLSVSQGKKLLGVVQIETEEDGTLVHRCDAGREG